MIFAIDIETIGNPAAVAQLPEPKANGRLKDPAKIAADIAEKKAAMLADAALNPLTARIACYAAVGLVGSGTGNDEAQEHVECIAAATDEAEREIVQSIMRVLGADEARIATWNGIGFDLPFIYKRAILLGIDPGDFGAPPLTAWTKRYATDKHYDLMQVWGGWSSQGFEKLDAVAGIVLGQRKAECDVTQIAEMIETEEGKKKVADYCLQDTRLTWALWKRFNGCLFA